MIICQVICQQSIKICHENNIQFVFLPTNSIHLTQPLDVAFFRPLKIHWRKILEDWKMGEGKEDTSIPKDKFPRLLKKLCLKINENGCENFMAGFKKCGIVPLNRDQVLDMFPDSRNYSENLTADTSSQSAIDESLKKFLELMRPSDQKQQRRKRTKLNVEPGMSVETITSENEDDPELVKEVEDMEEDKEKSFSHTNSSIYEVDSVEKPAFVKMHGKIFQNVYPIKSKSEILTDDWFVISFQINPKQPSSSKICYKYYVGQVIEKNDDIYKGTFLRGKSTREDNGFIYCFPNVKDQCEFECDQVVGRLDKPTVYKRGLLKFQLDFKTL